jgi:hypothetical protein
VQFILGESFPVRIVFFIIAKMLNYYFTQRTKKSRFSSTTSSSRSPAWEMAREANPMHEEANLDAGEVGDAEVDVDGVAEVGVVAHGITTETENGTLRRWTLSRLSRRKMERRRRRAWR